MSRRIENTRRSNHSLFLPQNYGSPFNDTAEHISELGLGRLDFERGAVAGEVIYTIEGDLTPKSQQEEEARIATLAYALKKLGNPEDAAEFMRYLNEISKEGDARYRQVVASYYYGEIGERGLGVVLKEMAFIAMHLASLNPVTEEFESDVEIVYAPQEVSRPRSVFDRNVARAWADGFGDQKQNGASLKEYKKASAHRLLFDLEVSTVKRMIRGRRKSARFVQDEMVEWLNDLESNGATLDELDDVFAHIEALDQYDEGGGRILAATRRRIWFLTYTVSPQGHEMCDCFGPICPDLVAALVRSSAEVEAFSRATERLDYMQFQSTADRTHHLSFYALSRPYLANSLWCARLRWDRNSATIVRGAELATALAYFPLSQLLPVKARIHPRDLAMARRLVGRCVQTASGKGCQATRLTA
jgi:hypothetical protein